MIGVVAGVGPYAGLDLLRKILSQTIAKKDQDHLPVASLSQPAHISDRTAFLLGQTTTNPALAIIEQLLKLEEIGAVVAGIPCNTAHAPVIFDLIRKGLADAGSKLNLLHMIAAVGDELRSVHPHVKKVGVLATTGAILTRIYPGTLDPLSLETLVVDREQQAQLIQPAIYDPHYGIKACGYATERARNNLVIGARQLKNRGAQALILGCTEIPLAFPEKEVAGLPTIDPALILARALIAAVDPARLRPIS